MKISTCRIAEAIEKDIMKDGVVITDMDRKRLIKSLEQAQDIINNNYGTRRRNILEENEHILRIFAALLSLYDKHPLTHSPVGIPAYDKIKDTLFNAPESEFERLFTLIVFIVDNIVVHSEFDNDVFDSLYKSVTHEANTKENVVAFLFVLLSSRRSDSYMPTRELCRGWIDRMFNEILPDGYDFFISNKLPPFRFTLNTVPCLKKDNSLDHMDMECIGELSSETSWEQLNNYINKLLTPNSSNQVYGIYLPNEDKYLIFNLDRIV